jgi:hypothetical protein
VGPPPLLFLSSFFARQAAKVAKFGAKPTANKEPRTSKTPAVIHGGGFYFQRNLSAFAPWRAPHIRPGECFVLVLIPNSKFSPIRFPQPQEVIALRLPCRPQPRLSHHSHGKHNMVIEGLPSQKSLRSQASYYQVSTKSNICIIFNF